MQKLIASPRRKLVSLASSSKSPVPVSAAFVTFRFFFLPPRVVVVVSHCPLQRELRGSVLGVSQGEAGPLLSCRLCPSCLQATLLYRGSESTASPTVPQGLRSQERGWTLCKATGQRSGKTVTRSDHRFKLQEAYCRPDGHIHWRDSSSLCWNETE